MSSWHAGKYTIEIADVRVDLLACHVGLPKGRRFQSFFAQELFHDAIVQVVIAIFWCTSMYALEFRLHPKSFKTAVRVHLQNLPFPRRQPCQPLPKIRPKKTEYL